jgi:hypothetical protein
MVGKLGGGVRLFTYKLTFKPFTTIFIAHPGVLRIKGIKKLTLVLLFAIIPFSFLFF